MTGPDLLFALLATFAATSAVCFAARLLGARGQYVVEAVHFAGISVALVFAVAVTAAVLDGQTVALFGSWLFADALGGIFVCLVTLVGFLTGLYSIGYLRNDLAKGAIAVKSLSVYYGFFHLFLFAMLMAVTSNNLIMMWVGIEATTLSSVFLVGFYGRKGSLEAAWKYIIICTVGVAFGLYGTVLVFADANAVMADANTAILWTEVVKRAQSLDPATISIAFVFVLIGFGTKAGLFPMHVWMPDAYSEAPSPVSGLLSAGLANCALLVIIRYAVIAATAAGPDLPRTLLLVFGTLSIGVTAFLIFVQRDLKRLLAYSSVENMGLIAVGLGIGGPLGVSAALLHTINHGLVKTMMFCNAGQIGIKYDTRDLSRVKGMLRVAPASGFLVLVGLLALGGVPPLNIFISELLTIIAGVKVGLGWLMAICAVLLTVVLASFARVISGSILGPAPEGLAKGDLGALTLAPLFLMLALVLVMGVRVPGPVVQLIARAGEIINAPAGQTLAQAAPGCASGRPAKETPCPN